MSSISPLSTETYTALCLLLTLPTLYTLSRRPTTPDPRRPRPPYRTILSLLLLAHTLYILHKILRDAPPNLFTQYNVPVTLPIDGIRAVLLARAGEKVAMSPRMEVLMSRLASFDMRTLYIRFGQKIVEECTHCRTADEFALHALPRPLLEYVREVAFIGLVTIRGSYRARWRTWGVVILCFAAVMEGYWLTTVPIELTPAGGGPVLWWHDNYWTGRQVIFLLLPLITHLLLPARPPRSPARVLTALPALTMVLDTLLKRLSLTRLSSAALTRDPSFQSHSKGWWAREQAEGEAVRRDVGVQRVAEKEGYGFEKEGEGLRGKARQMVEELWKGFDGSLDAPHA